MRLITAFLFLITLKAHAQVACSGADAGKMRVSGNLFQYCNGSYWVRLNAYPGSPATCTDYGKTSVVGISPNMRLRYCALNGQAFETKYSQHEQTNTGCIAAQAGKITYSGGVMRFCDGSTNFAMDCTCYADSTCWREGYRLLFANCYMTCNANGTYSAEFVNCD